MTITPEGRDTLREVFLLEGPHPPKLLALIGTEGQVIAKTPVGPHDWTAPRSGGLEVRKPFENLDTVPWSVSALALLAGPPFYVQALRAPVRVEVGQQAVFTLKAP
jgi:hypothetical protein